MFYPQKRAISFLAVLSTLFFYSPVFSSDSVSSFKSFDFDNPAGNIFILGDLAPELPKPQPVVDNNQPARQEDKNSCDFKIYFIDVGQGDSEFIQLPSCKTALIDGGPSSSVSSKFVKFLTAHNVTSIDYVVLTHPHTDHFKGLKYVFDKLSVSKFYDTRENNSTSATLQQVRQAAQNKPGLTIVYPSQDDVLDWDPQVGVKVLHSCDHPGDSSQGDVLNNCSIVVQMTYKNVSALFMGDSEVEVENNLIDKYGKALKSDVLKVGHHGSSTASSQPFLDLVQPKAAYVEVGKNSYGLPVADILSRIEKSGATVYRTDVYGTMEYSFPKNQMDGGVPFTPPPWEE